MSFPSGHLELLMSQTKRTKYVVNVLGEVTDLDQQQEIHDCVQQAITECQQGASWWFFALLCSMLKI